MTLGEALQLLAMDPAVGADGRVEVRRGRRIFRGTVGDTRYLAPAVGFALSLPVADSAPGIAPVIAPRAYCAKGGEAQMWVIALAGEHDA